MHCRSLLRLDLFVCQLFTPELAIGGYGVKLIHIREPNFSDGGIVTSSFIYLFLLYLAYIYTLVLQQNSKEKANLVSNKGGHSLGGKKSTNSAYPDSCRAIHIKLLYQLFLTATAVRGHSHSFALRFKHM